MNIWAHRGLSRIYPENTLLSFEKACAYDITGVELDVQLTRDRHLVVIHDETVDRTTDGSGRVADFSFEELRRLNIFWPEGPLHIPSLEETLALLRTYCLRDGLLINIELKNSVEPYPGMEQKVLETVSRFALEDYVIYSSFNPDSLQLLKSLDPSVEVGVLAEKASDCLYHALRLGADAIHPFIGALDRAPEDGRLAVRCWNVKDAEPFYPEECPFVRQDLAALSRQGVTDIFTNNCDVYCSVRAMPADAGGLLEPGSVDPKNGQVCQEENCLVNFAPIRVEQGMTLRWLAPVAEYRLFFYTPEINKTYIYEYVYAPESNWASYAPDRSVMVWNRESRVFSEDGYIRMVIRGANSRSLKDLMALEGNYRPALWASCFHREYADTVAKCRNGELKYLLLTDTHSGTNTRFDQSLQNLRLVSRRIHPQGILHLGDLTDGLLSREHTKRYAATAMEGLRTVHENLLLCIGNHDTNYFRGNPEAFSLEEASRFYLGKHSTNYAVDDAKNKVRMLFLESFDHRETNRYGFSFATVLFLKWKLLTAPADFRILIFSHVPPMGKIHLWSNTIRNEDAIIAACERHQRRCKNILAWFCGHNHSDFVHDGLSFPIVSLGCNKVEECLYRKTALYTTWSRRLNEASQDLWDVLIIHRDNTLELIRFGAGEDRRIVPHDTSN